MLDVLSLIDICLTGSLVVLVIFSGYENFVCRTDPARHATRPEWMTAIDFGGLKIKLLSSIVAITAIQTLRDYMDLDNRPDRSLAWSVGVHLTFVVSTVLLALERPHRRTRGAKPAITDLALRTDGRCLIAAGIERKASKCL